MTTPKKSSGDTDGYESSTGGRQTDSSARRTPMQARSAETTGFSAPRVATERDPQAQDAAANSELDGLRDRGTAGYIAPAALSSHDKKTSGYDAPHDGPDVTSATQDVRLFEEPGYFPDGPNSTERVRTIADGAQTPPSAPSAPVSPEKMLAESARFEDLGRIGLGGMGDVHLVNDMVLLRKVAMKSLHPKLAKKQEHAERFLREVQVTGRLDHPNIVPVHDVGFHVQGNTFFVMKHVDGVTLTKKIVNHRDKPLRGAVLAEFLRIFLKLTDAIGFSHSRGVIHRDLKPNNVMVGNHGEVYVMDWGIALLLDEDTSFDDEESSGPSRLPEFDGSLFGTVSYMAPEQADGRVTDVDRRTDVFGLGAILYEILTGQAPYHGGPPSQQLKRARAADVQHPSKVVENRHLPPGLCRIALKAMSKCPDERYQTVQELELDVEAFLRGGGWFETRTVPAGTVIMHEGDEPDAAYIIEEGRCEVYKIINGQRQVLRVLGPGEVFGETAIFTGKARTASVSATTDVQVVAITRESLDYELGEKGWLAVFVRALAVRFADLDRQISEMKEHAQPIPSPD